MLCDSCQNELNGQCYCNRTAYQQVEQKGGHVIDAAKREYCPRYRYATPEEKEGMRKEAEWYRRAVDFEKELKVEGK